MYEPAAGAPPSRRLGPLWRLDAGRTLFVGPLVYNAPHQHGAPVFLSSLGGPFGLRLKGGDWLACGSAMVPAGLSHELRLDGEPVMVLYAEPDAGGPTALASLVTDAEERDGAVVGRSTATSLARALYERADSVAWAAEALDDLLGFGRGRARREVDPRVAAAVAALAAEEAPTLGAVARAARLSPSRLQHLFKAEIGVPLRRYRSWTRMRRAIAEIVTGANFTTAAHAAGFADQAHFAHDFRATFGAPASVSLTRPRGS
ncbi:AraC-like DNA-binding protein [Methylopila capsulata]|uniref:AraC family transcriptional regulator n=1 Tax=Methylopila capsulata TaxID=61654 RepID=A0A9W6ITS6_9HYPH|nr:helix-turn-helix transcriptional regulator [Methylopila capsulata]MBM7850784.1 AraC-like DNA-binding protein [Methylopila capsulata]GLK56078.1 AraC family transcriptional regulator [Methylopila capsulata]